MGLALTYGKTIWDARAQQERIEEDQRAIREYIAAHHQQQEA